ncbi:MAG: aquaporin Z [Fibrobacter sp.]|jgi:aquaporin Z|nr:aquaporin Z [Fibrobacter sp.]
MKKQLLAEFFGTFWLVLGGCGSAVLAADRIGILGVALAFGLTVLTMVYAVGHISGGHFNPAVTFGLWAGGRFSGKAVIPYILSQIVGAILAAAILFAIVKGSASVAIGDFAANGYGAHSPKGFGICAAIITEFVMTFMFLFIILGATDKKASAGFAGLAIGLGLTLIHLISIPVTNTSVNPARSISQALFAEGGWALGQLWLFILVPIVGGICAGVVYKLLRTTEEV